MKKVLFSLLVLGATAAMAADGKAVFTSKGCVGCHGPDGKKTAMGNQSIAGWDAAKVEAALNGYVDGSYGGAKKGMMIGQAKKLSADEIKAVSAYISGL